MNEIKEVELVINEEKGFFGVDAISIVKNPAIESNFIALKAEPTKLKTLDEEKHILLGPALIPDKRILRLNKETGEKYNIFFTEETIREASQLFLKRNYQKESTLEHNFKLEGLTVVETWIKEDPEKDKSMLYGMDEPVGTWFIAMKVENPEVWDEYVKTGAVAGFSIEAWFDEKEVNKIGMKAEADFNLAELVGQVNAENKTMNKQIENIWAEAAPKKEELTKVELANLSGLKSMTSSLASERKNALKVADEIDAVNRRVRVNEQQAKAAQKEASKMLLEFEAQAKELGIKPQSVPEFKELEKYYQEVKDAVYWYSTLKMNTGL